MFGLPPVRLSREEKSSQTRSRTVSCACPRAGCPMLLSTGPTRSPSSCPASSSPASPTSYSWGFARFGARRKKTALHLWMQGRFRWGRMTVIEIGCGQRKPRRWLGSGGTGPVPARRELLRRPRIHPPLDGPTGRAAPMRPDEIPRGGGD